jgi:uncharacterized protein (TIGR00251 family)
VSLELRETARGVAFGVEVKVRASRTRVLGVKADRLSVALAAPPVDGAANEALCAALADYFDIPKSQVRLISGQKSRKKQIEIKGLTPAKLKTKLAALPQT